MNDLTSCAWLWMYLGAVLMLLEILAPGFVVFFFGLSAATVGLLRFALGETLTTTWQLAAFSGFSIVYLAVLRRLLKNIFSGAKSESSVAFDSDYIGRCGEITSETAPGMPGRVMLGDAEWTCEADEPIARGVRVRVVRQDNLTMKVEPVRKVQP